MYIILSLPIHQMWEICFHFLATMITAPMNMTELVSVEQDVESFGDCANESQSWVMQQIHF